MKLKYYFFILSSFFSFAQKSHYVIIYQQNMVSNEMPDNPYATTIKTYLNGDGEKSVYIEDWINMNNNEGTENAYSIKAERNPILFKELDKKTIIYTDEIRMKPFDVKDIIDSFDWKIESDSKIILGYKCQKATISRRGRNFTAYFASDLAFFDGPWKFFGLPGLILEINSSDALGSINIHATKVALKESKNEIKNPFLDKKTIAYKEFVTLYKKKYNETIDQMEPGDNSIGMSKGFREIYVTNK